MGCTGAFDPTTPPDGRRIAPVILPVVEGQLDIAVIKVLANDIVLYRDEASQEVTKIRVGVISAKDDSKIEGAGKFLKDIKAFLENLVNWEFAAKNLSK